MYHTACYQKRGVITRYFGREITDTQQNSSRQFAVMKTTNDYHPNSNSRVSMRSRRPTGNNGGRHYPDYYQIPAPNSNSNSCVPEKTHGQMLHSIP